MWKTIVSALAILVVLDTAALAQVSTADVPFRSPRMNDPTHDPRFAPYEPRNSTFPTEAEERGLVASTDVVENWV